MTPVYLDTIGLIAVWDEDDQWHGFALPVFLDILSAKRKLVTCSLVLVECGNAASRRPYRKDVCDLREKLILSGGLIEPTEGEISQAWADYRAARAGTAGIVDLISFAVMRRLGITDAFTNDKHFAAAGFTVLF
jgi:predicted nucleic acid-binding protein